MRRESRADEQEGAGEDEEDQRRAETDAEIGPVGDLANDLGRKGVAEEVNAEEID